MTAAKKLGESQQRESIIEWAGDATVGFAGFVGFSPPVEKRGHAVKQKKKKKRIPARPLHSPYMSPTKRKRLTSKTM